MGKKEEIKGKKVKDADLEKATGGYDAVFVTHMTMLRNAAISSGMFKVNGVTNTAALNTWTSSIQLSPTGAIPAGYDYTILNNYIASQGIHGTIFAGEIYGTDTQAGWKDFI